MKAVNRVRVWRCMLSLPSASGVARPLVLQLAHERGSVVGIPYRNWIAGRQDRISLLRRMPARCGKDVTLWPARGTRAGVRGNRANKAVQERSSFKVTTNRSGTLMEREGSV